VHSLPQLLVVALLVYAKQKRHFFVPGRARVSTPTALLSWRASHAWDGRWSKGSSTNGVVRWVSEKCHQLMEWPGGFLKRVINKWSGQVNWYVVFWERRKDCKGRTTKKIVDDSLCNYLTKLLLLFVQTHSLILLFCVHAVLRAGWRPRIVWPGSTNRNLGTFLLWREALHCHGGLRARHDRYVCVLVCVYVWVYDRCVCACVLV